MSVAGGMTRSIDRALGAGCESLQVFTKNNNQWRAHALRDEDVATFRVGVEESGLQPVLAHASYLINMGTPDDVLWNKSIDSLDEELTRCEILGIPLLVVHPGSHVGSGEDAAIRRIAGALDEVHSRHPGSPSTILLENTAGQGSAIGYRLEHLAEIMQKVSASRRVGVCIDTAHLYAAGYDIGTSKGWDATWSDFDRHVGFGKLAALHVNDSKRPLASRVDRHEHIGSGLIPILGFLLLMNDERLGGLPAILETAKTEVGHEDAQNMAVLRRLAGRKRPPTAAQVVAWREAAWTAAVEKARREVPQRAGRGERSGRGSTRSPRAEP